MTGHPPATQDAARRRPDLFIVGAPKCGTTSLYEYLKGHPEVFMSPRKEPRYFAPELMTGAEGKNLRYGVDEERYLDLFSEARDEKRLGEASVRYLYSEQAPGLIRQFEPGAFIVVMIRNPVDMIYSLHAHRVSGGGEEITDFEQALAAEEERRLGRGIRPDSNALANVYRDRGRFAEHLPRWFETFGRERVHVIVFEDMVRDAAGEFRRLLEFLEIDPDYQPESFDAYNPRHKPRSEAVRGLLRSRLPQWLLWSALPRVVGERRAQALVRPFRRFNRRPAERQQMSAQLQTRLEAEFTPDVARLSEMLGRDLAALWWGRPATSSGSSVATAGSETVTIA